MGMIVIVILMDISSRPVTAILLRILCVLSHTDNSIDHRSDNDFIGVELTNNGHLLVVVLLLHPLVASNCDHTAHSITIQSVLFKLDAVSEGDGRLAKGRYRSQCVLIVGCLCNDVLG